MRLKPQHKNKRKPRTGQLNLRYRRRYSVHINNLISIADIFNKKQRKTAPDMESEEDSQGEFTLVQNKKRKIDLSSAFEPVRTPSTNNPMEVTNYYSPLETIINEDADIQTDNQQQFKKPKMPPPVVMHQKVNDHKSLIKQITQLIGKNFHIKHVGGRTAIQAYDYGKYKILKRELAENNLQFHTYTPAEEKTHGFVIRGLDSNPTPEEIQQDINETHKLVISKVFKMKTNFRPLFLVVTNKDINLTFLQQNIKFVCSTKIKWERHANTKLITQCRRCQEWGHATSNCFVTPRCAHCASEHWTHQCTNKEANMCANCNQTGHKAFANECPVYVKRLALTRKSEKPAEPRYQDAPLPSTNAWAQRPITEVVPAASNQRRETTPPVERPGPSNKEDFPALPSGPRHQQPRNRKPEPEENEFDSANQFENLSREFKKLNSLVNLEKMLVLVVKLNKKLETAKSNLDKFLIIRNFTSELTDDDF